MGQFHDAIDAAKTGRRDDVHLSYYTVQPNANTFESTKLRGWFTSEGDGPAWWKGRVLNACAGETVLDPDHHVDEIIRNDIDPEVEADLHVDVCEIADYFDSQSFDTIIFDPPYSEYQATKHYEGRNVGNVALAKRNFHSLLRAGGRVIQFGYTTTCMPYQLRYERLAVAVFNTLGQMHDVLGAVDMRFHADITTY